MRVLHSGALNVKAGGPALSTMLTIRGLQNNGVEVVDICRKPGSCDQLIDANFQPIYTADSRFGTFAYIPGLKRMLKKLGPYDLYHIQGMWMHHGIVVSNYATQHNRPYVVTLRGMLYPQALAHHKFVKKLMMSAFQRKVLANAAAIQCTCKEEMEHYRQLGFRNPVAIIPNPIETEGIINREPIKKTTFKFGYLGRIHRRKRIERLIQAFAEIQQLIDKPSELEIIGSGDEEYTNFLKAEVKRLNLCNVRFRGFLTGQDKDDAIQSLSILVVPSDFENFGNIVTEALVRGVPVITSKGTPWQALETYGCGWWIDNNVESIGKYMLDASRLSVSELSAMGQNGKELIRREYSVDVLGKRMYGLYRWILNPEAIRRPEFVYELP